MAQQTRQPAGFTLYQHAASKDYSVFTLDGSIHKLNRKLIHKRPAVHRQTVLSTRLTIELNCSRTLADEFVPNPGLALLEVSASQWEINVGNSISSDFTTPKTVEYHIKHLDCHKALGADCIANTALSMHQKLLSWLSYKYSVDGT